jgi:hypothetical protein
MQATRTSTIAILGAILLGTAFISGASAQCGLAPLPLASPSRPAPTAWHPLNPSHGNARLVTASYSSTSANWDDRDSDDDSIVGMWHAVFTAKGNGGSPPDGTPIDNSLIVWHSDKTEIMNSGRPAQDGDFCMGVWERTGRNSYKLNHFAWAGNDTANAPAGIGNPAGPTHIVENIVVGPDGKHYAGTFTLDAYDTSGNVTTHITGVITATRITIDTTVANLL